MSSAKTRALLAFCRGKMAAAAAATFCCTWLDGVSSGGRKAKLIQAQALGAARLDLASHPSFYISICLVLWPHTRWPLARTRGHFNLDPNAHHSALLFVLKPHCVGQRMQPAWKSQRLPDVQT